MALTMHCTYSVAGMKTRHCRPKPRQDFWFLLRDQIETYQIFSRPIPLISGPRPRCSRPRPRHFSRPYTCVHSTCFEVTTRLASSLRYSFNTLLMFCSAVSLIFLVERKTSQSFPSFLVHGSSLLSYSQICPFF